MKIEFTVQIWKEGKMFVSFAPELDVSSCGKTENEARKNILEAVSLFLQEAKKMGTVHQILKEAGFQKRNSHFEPPIFVSLEKKELTFA